jgi:hypothetical protein
MYHAVKTTKHKTYTLPSELSKSMMWRHKEEDLEKAGEHFCKAIYSFRPVGKSSGCLKN